MTAPYELLTVRAAAEALMKSERGVLRLIRRGKLTPIREGRRYFLPVEELQRYAATLPHPVPVMAALYDARDILAYDRQEKKLWPVLRLDPALRTEAHPLHDHFLPYAVPICQGIVEAAKGRDYGRVEALRLDLYRLRVDYQMLYAPLRTPRVEARERAAAGELMPSLFPEADRAGGEV